MSSYKNKNFILEMDIQIKTELRSGLNGALFAQRSGAKKREWKTETSAQKNYTEFRLNIPGL